MEGNNKEGNVLENGKIADSSKLGIIETMLNRAIENEGTYLVGHQESGNELYSITVSAQKIIKDHKTTALDLVGNNGEVYPSEAKAIKMLGIALEEVEKNILWKLGGRIGGARELADVLIEANDGFISTKVALLFDVYKLNAYIRGENNEK
jgi:hypothetical protein